MPYEYYYKLRSEGWIPLDPSAYSVLSRVAPRSSRKFRARYIKC
jgi:hypothetical protein